MRNQPLPTEPHDATAANEDSDHEVTLVWLDNLAEGQHDAVQEFWNHYGDSLQRVAERQIASWLRRRVDPEDVVQSACRTFFRRAGDGAFNIESRDDLWRLLLTITLNKVRMQARFHSRNRRSITKERAMPEEANLQPAEWDEAIQQVELRDMLEVAFSHHDDERKRVLEMWLDGSTQNEIASDIGCSERTVRRIQDRIRKDLGNYMSTDEETLS